MTEMQDHHGEVALWRAVIYRSLMDAAGIGLRTTGGPGTRKRLQSEAATWLQDGGKDFREVCFLALLDPGYVQGRAAAFVETASAKEWREQKRQIKRLERMAAKLVGAD